MKVVIPTIPTLLSLSALLSVSASSTDTEEKGMIRRNARMEEGSGEPEVADIINGTPTGKALPYQVGLSIGTGPVWGIPECGGSLIASRVVLTAAHCYMEDPILSTVKVNMYDTDPDSPGSTSINLSPGERGVDIIPHPDYNPATGENDVALVILPVGQEEGDNIKYTKLNKDPNVPAADERLYISGWGRTEPDIPAASDILLGTVVNYVPPDSCTGAPKGTMCTYKEGTGPCIGDSGGPLVIASEDETAPATEPPLKSASYLLYLEVAILLFTLV
jgi:hypothetical protein